MIKLVGIVSALIFGLDALPAARAQVMLDELKITCDQFAGYKITTPQNVAIWLSGYYHGKRGTTVVDMQKLLADTKTMERYCIQNPQTLVMNAVETVLGVGKWALGRRTTAGSSPCRPRNPNATSMRCLRSRRRSSRLTQRLRTPTRRCWRLPNGIAKAMNPE